MTLNEDPKVKTFYNFLRICGNPVTKIDFDYGLGKTNSQTSNI